MNIPFVFKKCTKCGRWLVASKINFYKAKSGKYGLNSKCKECYNAYYRERYQANIENERARVKKYDEAHKEEKREYHKEYDKNYYQKK